RRARGNGRALGGGARGHAAVAAGAPHGEGALRGAVRVATDAQLRRRAEARAAAGRAGPGAGAAAADPVMGQYRIGDALPPRRNPYDRYPLHYGAFEGPDGCEMTATWQAGALTVEAHPPEWARPEFVADAAEAARAM